MGRSRKRGKNSHLPKRYRCRTNNEIRLKRFFATGKARKTDSDTTEDTHSTSSSSSPVAIPQKRRREMRPRPTPGEATDTSGDCDLDLAEVMSHVSVADQDQAGSVAGGAGISPTPSALSFADASSLIGSAPSHDRSSTLSTSPSPMDSPVAASYSSAEGQFPHSVSQMRIDEGAEADSESSGSGEREDSTESDTEDSSSSEDDDPDMALDQDLLNSQLEYMRWVLIVNIDGVGSHPHRHCNQCRWHLRFTRIDRVDQGSW